MISHPTHFKPGCDPLMLIIFWKIQLKIEYFLPAGTLSGVEMDKVAWKKWLKFYWRNKQVCNSMFLFEFNSITIDCYLVPNFEDSSIAKKTAKLSEYLSRKGVLDLLYFPSLYSTLETHKQWKIHVPTLAIKRIKKTNFPEKIRVFNNRIWKFHKNIDMKQVISLES